MHIIPLVDCYYNFTKGSKYPVAKAIGHVIYVYDDFDNLTVIQMPEIAKSFLFYRK